MSWATDSGQVRILEAERFRHTASAVQTHTHTHTHTRTHVVDTAHG